ncbi:acetylesterase [Hirsutella rhossiliensis]|uniref:Acetylesterase n=1 Tax=Hirsutella rhossiliensis TaxID=111463 RepID=A0A9P8SCX5_9HYPO|nr:acetylesterase [Hirsutella rhossiliensis]KAH0958021.1 acetylesterase [Hirsutella rhossiliensis]
MATKLLLAALAVGASVGATPGRHHHAAEMDNLITFGDSYTDEGRSDYFVRHHAAPPEGLVLPPNNATFSGGYAWSRLVARRTGAASYNYAVAGAMCSDALVDRFADIIGGPFPSVLDYEVPAFEADVADAANRRRRNNSSHHRDDGDGSRLFPDRRRRRADNSVYATLASFADCVWAVFDRLHHAGGRRFVLVNQLPLELAPMYARPGVFGQGSARFLRDPAAHNVTEFRDKLRQYTTAVNTMFEYGVPFHLRRWPDAVFSLLDAHAIVTDVHADPAGYLDAPANATAPYRRCTQACVNAPEPLSSFVWFDELHPSERMQEIFAKHFTDLVVHGRSKYGKRYHG